IQVLASFPMPMLFPFLAGSLVNAGISFNVAAMLLMLVGTQWYLLFNIVAGAAAVPGDLEEVARLYRLGPLERFRLLHAPSILPYFVTGLVTAAGGAWNTS